MISTTTALWFTLGGALGAAILAAGATVLGVVLSNRHDREVRRSDRKFEAFADLITAAEAFRTRSKVLVFAYRETDETHEDEVDAYLTASWQLGQSAQRANIFIAGTMLQPRLETLDDAHSMLSHAISVETDGAVRHSGEAALPVLPFEDAVAIYDQELTALTTAVQQALGLR